MSNSAVPIVYGHIIKDVITNCQKDFEECGISQAVLFDLEKMWEERISTTTVANFDNFLSKTIENDNLPSNNNTTTSVKTEDATESKPPAFSTMPDSRYSTHEPSFRPTAELLNSMPFNNMYPGLHNTNYQPANLPNLLNQNGNHLNGIRLPAPPNLNYGDNDRYAQMSRMPAFPTHFNSNFNPYIPPPLNPLDGEIETQPSDYKINANRPPQFDGSADCSEVNEGLLHKDDSKKLSQQEIDTLMLKKWKKMLRLRKVSQVDGPVEIEADDNDEDAINSDLDDSDEGDVDESDKDGTDHIILCQYDKVSRTKNRWRCALKDGIIHVNGKDYLFNKSTGEFQW